MSLKKIRKINTFVEEPARDSIFKNKEDSWRVKLTFRHVGFPRNFLRYNLHMSIKIN